MTTLARSLNTRAVRRLEKPRPLNRPTEAVEPFVPSVESNISEGVMTLIDFVSSTILKENFDDVLAVNIGMLCKQLEMYGAQLEASNKAQLDKAFYLFRDASRDGRLDHVARWNLLKLIELRDSHWQPGNNFTSFYTASFSPGALESAVNELSLSSKASVPYPPPSPVLNPGEMIKASGKFPKPTKMPGKSYCKDEVVIRNADSGKVMGIKGRRVHMIEELSETIISFQRVPSGAKERLVQITGPSEDNITHAIHLMDDTIRRNASPIREPVEKDQMGGSSSSLNSSASDESNRLANHISEKRLHSSSTNESSFDDFKYTVTVGNDVIRIVSSNFGLAMTAKLVLDEHFANASNTIESSDYFSPNKSNSSVFSPGVNDIVPSISKISGIENDSFKSSGVSLSNSSSLHPSFSSLSSSQSGIGYSDVSGSLLSNTLQSQVIAQPFSSYVDNNVINDPTQIANQSVLGSSSSITSLVSPSGAANDVLLSSLPTQLTPLSIAEVSDGPGKTFSLNQSLSALLSVTSTKKDQPRIKQYSKDALEAIRSSSVCLEPPPNWDRILAEFPHIVKPRRTVSAPTTPIAVSAPCGLPTPTESPVAHGASSMPRSHSITGALATTAASGARSGLDLSATAPSAQRANVLPPTMSPALNVSTTSGTSSPSVPTTLGLVHSVSRVSSAIKSTDTAASSAPSTLGAPSALNAIKSTETSAVSPSTTLGAPSAPSAPRTPRTQASSPLTQLGAPSAIKAQDAPVSTTSATLGALSAPPTPRTPVAVKAPATPASIPSTIFDTKSALSAPRAPIAVKTPGVPASNTTLGAPAGLSASRVPSGVKAPDIPASSATSISGAPVGSAVSTTHAASTPSTVLDSAASVSGAAIVTSEPRASISPCDRTNEPPTKSTP